MTINFKNKVSDLETDNIIKNLDINKNNIIDLTNLNLFDATKSIILVSTHFFSKYPNKKLKYKVSNPNIQNLLVDIPMRSKIELI